MAHSTVTYVEPNMQIGFYGDNNSDYPYLKDNLEKSPRLEDYCIAFNIEVEVSSRDSQASKSQANKDVIIMQWNSNNRDNVNFLAGTKIGGYDVENGIRTARIAGGQQNLTTYYADMYVGDLIDFGTSELIGIKSVNIEYEKSCVPIITVKFTDVRGLSLFQPTELSRNNSYDGIRGLNKENVAQSFFQCFFKMPLPRYTIYIKGFYGKPVAYVVMCDKFDTEFDSDTGSFDATARFIGFSYSFLTDVTFDAILAAPYSDYEGRRYWEENVRNGRFFLWDKLKIEKKPMPTLFHVLKNINDVLNNSNEEEIPTSITEEDLTHEDEIKQLGDLRIKFQDWYSELYNLLVSRFGKRYVFDFKEKTVNEADSDWYRILILTNSKTFDSVNLSNEYEQFSSFKKTNDDLYAAIEEFNNNANNYKKIENISKDFSAYTRKSLFNECYINRNDKKIEFNGFSKDFNGNKTQIVNRLFYSKNTDDTLTKDYTLSTIYADGVDQYVDAYFIDVDYSDIKRRINLLNKDSQKSAEQKERDFKRKEHNRIMMSKLDWYPSVENFTKIMMAHLETFMMMMYKVAEACGDRTPKDLGITIGSEGIACDVNGNSNVVPPFPRVSKVEVGSDNISKVVDAWVGDWDNGSGFEEVEIINGLFNAMSYIEYKYEASSQNNFSESEMMEDTPPSVKHPLTTFDFFLKEDPYGIYNDVDNDPNTFAGKIAIRMFSILALNYLKREYPSSFSNENDFIKTLGEIEAENFYENHKLSKKLINLLGTSNDNATITPKAILQCVSNGVGIGNDDLPWKNDKNDDNLFDSTMSLTKYTTSYSKSMKTRIFPIQSIFFKGLNETLKYFNKGSNSIEKNNKDIFVDWVDAFGNINDLLTSNNDSCFGSFYVAEDYKLISNLLGSSNTSPNSTYKEMYNLIFNDSVFNDESYKKLIYKNGVFRPKKGITFKNYYVNPAKNNIESLYYDNQKNRYNFDASKLPAYVSEVKNQDIQSWFFTECRGFTKDSNGLFQISTEKSLFEQSDFMSEIKSLDLPFCDEVNKEMAFFLMGLEAIDYTELNKIINVKKSFIYLPKLAILQIGAALSTLNETGGGKFSRNIPLPRTFTSIMPYINNISRITQVAYIKYFKKWCDEYSSTIIENLINGKLNNAAELNVGENKRILYKEDTAFSSSLANNLMKCVCLVKASPYHHIMDDNYSPKVESNVATKYLDGFLSKLRELCSNTSENATVRATRMTNSPTKVTEDMKKELYRYLKLLYDKWIPVYDKKNWMFETFFDDESNKDTDGGHLFHFIDSYYNKIGDKLLINPSKLAEKMTEALKSNDVNIMMLGFMADIFQQNRCMLLCLQNFLDLGKPENMNDMFKPIPYNSMEKPKRHPDFVVIYPYQPSQNLNIDNGEFNDDSFMLNDEIDTPLPIKSRGENEDGYYRLPAFGVSYGKQYQSYFKKVSVGTSNPIATQQVILAKHAILKTSTNNNEKSTVAQDLYDIYTTQSHTCKVEMLGCAWIQPLMYFVLTNVPMFRGSYLIFKVTHRITPGNMITEFSGTRMANVSNNLVEEIFTDEDSEEALESYQIERREKLADIENDCQYKIYPLFESEDVSLAQNEIESGITFIKSLVNNKNLKPHAAAGIVGNMFQESRFDKTACHIDNNGCIAGGLFQWNEEWTSLTYFFKKNVGDYGKKVSESMFKQDEDGVKKAKEMLGKETAQSQLDFMVETLGNVSPKISINILNNECTSPEEAAVKFRKSYEKGSDEEARKSYARKFYDAYQNSLIGKDNSDESKTNEDDIYQAFFNAVNKSAQNTPSIGVELSNTESKAVSKLYSKILTITQKNGKTDKLANVFDMILNSEYYNYVQDIIWVYVNSPIGNPDYLCVRLSKNPTIENRLVLFTESNNISKKENKISISGKFSSSSEINKKFLLSIKKKYGTLPNKEVPQLVNKNILDDTSILNCSDLVRNEIITVPSKPSPLDEGKIDGWDVGGACAYLINHAHTETQHACAAYVEDAIAYGGKGPLSKRMYCGGKTNAATNLRYRKILENNDFKIIEIGEVSNFGGPKIALQAGDVAIIGRDVEKGKGGKFHACMYTASKGWISDFFQNNMSPYKDTYPYALYRFGSGIKS